MANDHRTGAAGDHAAMAARTAQGRRRQSFEDDIADDGTGNGRATAAPLGLGGGGHVFDDDAGTVSYTHLDVYKRQVVLSAVHPVFPSS